MDLGKYLFSIKTQSSVEKFIYGREFQQGFLKEWNDWLELSRLVYSITYQYFGLERLFRIGTKIYTIGFNSYSLG